ncbi:enoyl-CoA hydratase/isomerase family protein [Mycobacterium sherrisii]|uniref:enoyl-CoA hydratase/isomerase family protein n=1 Tax=Mycobacterium sherrisii TaxID=243061 RepID=UPI003974D09E
MYTVSHERLRIEQQGSVMTATLCRGDAGNGMDRLLAESLVAWADQVVTSAQAGRLRVAVLRNQGFAFCVGGDLVHFTNAANMAAELSYVAGSIHEALKALTAAPVPIVTVVDGVAAGGGVGLALVGDIVIGTPATKFKMAYTSVGLSPDCGGSWFLTQRVGLGRALEMTLSDRTVGVDEAQRIGLVGPVSDSHAGTDQTVDQVTERLASMSRESLATTKRLIRSSLTTDLFAHLDMEAYNISRLGATADGLEGVRAFSEKRPPVFGNSRGAAVQ